MKTGKKKGISVLCFTPEKQNILIAWANICCCASFLFLDIYDLSKYFLYKHISKQNGSKKENLHETKDELK